MQITVLRTASSTLPVGEPVVRHDAPLAFGTQVQAHVGPYEIQLISYPMGTTSDTPVPSLSDEQLVRIARSITPAGDFNDPSTWIPAVAALPAT